MILWPISFNSFNKVLHEESESSSSCKYHKKFTILLLWLDKDVVNFPNLNGNIINAHAELIYIIHLKLKKNCL